MEAVFVVIMLGALGLAVALALVGWKLLRQGHESSDVRVEMLRALAEEPVAESVPIAPAVAEEPIPARAAVAVAPPVQEVAFRHVETQVRAEDDAVPVFARLASFAPDTPAQAVPTDWDSSLGHASLGLGGIARVPDVPEVSVVATRGSLAAPHTPNRMPLVAAGLVIVMLASAGTVYAVYRPQVLAAAWHTRPDDRVPSNIVPLELLSLNEATSTDGTFTITGLVGNPTAGQAAHGIVAVVYLFDRDGHYFATGRSAIDLASLAPGDQSPFVVKVPHGVGVTRYRVGFRQADGAVAAHVDKRGEKVDGLTEGLLGSEGSKGSEGSEGSKGSQGSKGSGSQGSSGAGGA